MLMQLRNCLTIDLESVSHRYVTETKHLSGVEKRYVETEEGRRLLDGGSLVSSTKRILQALREQGQAVTFFVVGEVYKWYPNLVHELGDSAHELAYHSHTHTPFKTAGALRGELQRSREFIETFKPKGFRAPRALITHECLSELVRFGFTYDSSSYGPFSTARKMSGITEIPISTYAIGKDAYLTLPRPLTFDLLRRLEIPYGSGYFISLLSSASPALVSYFIRKSNAKGIPAILSFHPWQLSCKRARIPVGKRLFRLAMLPYDVPCDRAFEHILRSHDFCTMQELIEENQAT